MTWHEAMRRFGSDKPDLRFGMEFVELMDVLKGTGEFPVFNEAEYIGGIVVPGCAEYTRKQLDQLTDFVKRPQVGAKGLVYVKFNADGTVKSSIDKFYQRGLAEAEGEDRRQGWRPRTDSLWRQG